MTRASAVLTCQECGKTYIHTRNDCPNRAWANWWKGWMEAQPGLCIECQQAREARETTDSGSDGCNHSWYMLSHEERKCRRCGVVEFVPDL